MLLHMSPCDVTTLQLNRQVALEVVGIKESKKLVLGRMTLWRSTAGEGGIVCMGVDDPPTRTLLGQVDVS